MTTTSNIDDFKKQYRQFYRNILKLNNPAGEVIETMKQSVMGKIGLKHNQSAQLFMGLTDDAGGIKYAGAGNGENNTEPRKLLIGFGNLDFLNEIKRKQQSAMFYDGTKTVQKGLFEDSQVKQFKAKMFRLKAEEDLPEWIILEFGRKSGSNGASPRGIPKDFQINYSSRKSKPYLFGPSLSKHFLKPVFFMFDGKEPDEHNSYNSKGKLRKHPGSKGTHMFQDGLKNAIPEINRLLGEGLKENARQYAQKYGGRVE